MARCPECGHEILAPVDFDFWLFMNLRRRTPLDAVLRSQLAGKRSLFASWDRFSCSHCKAAPLAMRFKGIALYYAMAFLFFLFGVTAEGWLVGLLGLWVFPRVPGFAGAVLLASLSAVIIVLAVRFWYYAGVAVWWKSFAALEKIGADEDALRDRLIRFDSLVLIVTIAASGLCVWLAMRIIAVPLPF
jgi:hypothetical protein